MKNIFKIIQQSNVDITKPPTEGTFDYEALLLQHGQVFFTPKNFNLESLIREINDFLLKDLKLGTEIKNRGESVVEISFKIVKGLKKVIGLEGCFSVLLMKTELRLWFSVVADEDIANPDKKEFIKKMSAIFDDSHKKEIHHFISDYFVKQYQAASGFFEIDEENRFIEKLSPEIKIAYYSSGEEKEILLAALQVSDLKVHPQKEELDRKTDFFYFLTDKGAFLQGFDYRGNLIFSEDLSDLPIVVKNEIGRNPIKAGEISWFSTRANDNLFFEIQRITDLFKNDRIRCAAALNFNEGNRNYSKKLVEKLSIYDQDISDLWSLFYIDYVNEKSNNSDVAVLSEIIRKTAESEGAEEKFLKWLGFWKVSDTEKIGLMYLILKSTADKEIIRKLSNIHKIIHDDYLKRSKDNISNVLCSLILARHYSECGLKENAEKIILTALEELPDEAICDVIPDYDKDSNDFLGGQFLKSEFYNLLILNKGPENAKEYVKQLALLLPMNPEHFNAYLTLADGKTKTVGQEWGSILNEGLKNQGSFDIFESFNPIPEKMFDTFLRHPATRKKASLHWVQSITDTISEPDFSAVKAFSEILSESEFPEVFKLVHELRKSFGINFLEIYVARGDASSNITAFDGNPPFLFIGSKILDQAQDCGLTLAELKFAVAARLSNLVFKFSHITSTPEWETWYEKSTVSLRLADLFLKKDKAVSSVMNFFRFLEIQNFFENEKTVSHENFGIELSKQFSSLLQFSPENDKKILKNLVITVICNTILFTSDRAGLLFAGNLSVAVNSILKSNKKYIEAMQNNKSHSFKSFLLMKNPDETLKFPELILRIQNLVAFYMSFEYMELRTIVKSGK